MATTAYKYPRFDAILFKDELEYLQHTNYCFGTIDSIIGDADGEDATFTVSPDTNSATLPATGQFNIVVYGASCSQPSHCASREIIRIKSRSSNTLTIKSRNQESTTHSGAWSVGSKYALVWTAGAAQQADITSGTINKVKELVVGDDDALLMESRNTIVFNIENPHSQIRVGTVFHAPDLTEFDAESAAVYTRVDPVGTLSQKIGWYGEITDAQEDTEAAFCKIIHKGAGDAFYVAMRSPNIGSAAYEAAAFSDGTKGFISTVQAADLANCTLFNALWEQVTIPNYGMVYCDQAIARAITIRKMTGANDGYEQIRLMNTALDRNHFAVYNSGKTQISSAKATSGDTEVDSPDLTLTGGYWDGAANVDRNFIMRHVVTGSAASEARWLIGTAGFESIVAILKSGIFDIQGGTFYTGDVYLNSDTKYYWAGAGLDMKIGYDGTDGHIKTDLVAPSDLHIDCGTAKTLVMDIPTWGDLRVPALSVKVNANPPGLDTGFAGDADLVTYNFSGTAVEQCYFTVQLPHRWQEGTTIYPHVHFAPTSTNGSDTNTRNVSWKLEYTWQDIDEIYGGTSSIEMNVDGGFVPNTTQWKHLIATNATGIAGTNLKISSILVCRLYRDIEDSQDDYEQDVALLGVDFHYKKDTLGSRTETVK